MIPKLIHHIWIGNKSIPDEFISFRDKWKLMYPVDINRLHLIERTPNISSSMLRKLKFV